MIDPCGESQPLIIDELSGQLSSPNYPQNYPSNANCSWMINPTTSSLINLTFTAMNIEIDQQCK